MFELSARRYWSIPNTVVPVLRAALGDQHTLRECSKHEPKGEAPPGVTSGGLLKSFQESEQETNTQELLDYSCVPALLFLINLCHSGWFIRVLYRATWCESILEKLPTTPWFAERHACSVFVLCWGDRVHDSGVVIFWGLLVNSGL